MNDKSSGTPILTTERLVAGYEPDLPIVRGVSISVAEGEVVVVLGPNGAGKSTLIKAMAGLVRTTRGRVSLAGEDITSLPAHRMAHRGLAFVPQTDNVFVRMTIEDNLKLSAAVLAKPSRRDHVDAVYDFFPDLARQRRLLAGRLSGGQRQMLAIARAMMIAPKVLVLDEASAGLSPKLVGEVFAKLFEIRLSGVAILLVEQNARAALTLGDRAYVLVDGRVVHEGPAVPLRDDPALAHLFFGAGATVQRDRAAG